jgi:hypothetical protein
MFQNKIPKVCFCFYSKNGISSCFLFQGMVRNRMPRVYFYFCSTGWNSKHFFYSAEKFGTELEFREFVSIFVPRCGIPSIFLFRGMVRNGILRVFGSAEQPELRRNKPLFHLFRLLRNYFFAGNSQPYL